MTYLFVKNRDYRKGLVCDIYNVKKVRSSTLLTAKFQVNVDGSMHIFTKKVLLSKNKQENR